MKCPECKSEMKKVKWDVGFGILIDSFHCLGCRFNLTKEEKLDKAMEELKK